MRPINKIQILIGVIALAIGSLVYIVDRPPDQTYFVYSSGISVSLHNFLPSLFGVFSNTLPAFIHVFSFILITGGLIACRKKGCLIICLSWLIIDCASELGQEFNTWSSEIIPAWFSGIPFLENSKNYFLLGTFDFFDMAAITIGTVTAYFVLLGTTQRRYS
jgi:ABC-type xylose transport system permease subunit